tara:strand:- start:13335 stop:13499 length:165 start_codon:yes stop_codon:yes gene_type:complete
VTNNLTRFVLFIQQVRLLRSKLKEPFTWITSNCSTSIAPIIGGAESSVNNPGGK